MFRKLLPIAVSPGRCDKRRSWRALRRRSKLKAVKVDLPDSDTMFPARPGFGSDQQQLPRLSLSRYGLEPAGDVETGLGSRSQQDDQQLQAPIALEDVAAIVDYLTALKGAK